jgi:hypothetical protein
MTERLVLRWVVGFFLVCFVWFGLIPHNQPEPDPAPTRTIVKTKTVTKTVRVPVPTMTDNCKQVITLAHSMSKSSEKLDNASTELLDYIARFRVSQTSGDINEANDIETDLRVYQEHVLGTTMKLSSLTTQYDKARAACEDDMQ